MTLRAKPRTGLSFLLSSLLLLGGTNSWADIVIGQTSPITGVAGETGKGLALGAKIYFDYINESGGIHGQKIRHIVKDDQYQVTRTIENTKQLIDQDKSLALVNFYGTGNIGELIKQQLLDKANIALVGVYTGALSVREPFTPYIFHTRAGYHDEVEKIISMLGDMGMNQVGVFYQADPFGEAGLVAAKKSAEKHKMTFAGEASYPKLTADVKDAAEKLAKLNPQAIIMVSITKPTAAFVPLFRKLGGSSQLFNISVANYEEMVRLDGSQAMHGIGISQVYPSPDGTRLKVASEYQELLKRYAPEAKPSYASMEGFINAKILVEGIKRAGKSPSRPAVVKALESLQDFDLGNFKINFNNKSHQGSRFVELTMIGQGGELAR